MANQKFQKPFNLLYKFEPQKSSIDKIYDFVTVQGRLIVIGVMFIIIVGFVYRFPLDKALNDEINRSKDNLEQVKYYSKDTEKQFRDTFSRTQAAAKFLKLYNEDLASAGKKQIIFATFLKRISEIKNSFGDDILIETYSYSANPVSHSSLKIAGISSTSSKAQDFKDKILAEQNYVSQASYTNLDLQKETLPRFSLDITLKY